MINKNQDGLNDSSMLQSKNSNDSYSDFINTTNENIQDIESQNVNMYPSHSPQRSQHQKKKIPKEFNRIRGSLNMRPSDNISRSQGLFHKEDIPYHGRNGNKHDYQSQKSNQRINMKYGVSGSNSKTNSYHKLETSDYMNVQESNLKIKEMGEGSPKDDFIERENRRMEGVRTPNQFRSRPFSRKSSEMHFPRKSESSLSRLKSGENGNKFSSKKRYEVAHKIKENEEIMFLRNKIKKLRMQLNSGKMSDSKLKEQIEEMKKKNLLLREQVKELKKSKDQISKEKINVSSNNP
jgi:hypothetical protein